MISPIHYLGLCIVLFGVGVMIVIVRRHPLIVLLGVELALQAVSLSMVALTSWFQEWSGEIAVLVIMAISVVQFTAGLAGVLTYIRTPSSTRQSAPHAE